MHLQFLHHNVPQMNMSLSKANGHVLIRSITYDAVYDTIVVPAQKLKDFQQEIDGLKKIKVTR